MLIGKLSNNRSNILCRVMQAKFNTPNQFSQQATNGGRTKMNTGQAYKSGFVMGSGDTANGYRSSSSEAEAGEEDNGDETVHTGFLKEWTLMLHGTREPPYSQLSVQDPHSKLAIVKKAHTIAGPDTTVSSQQHSAY